MEPPKKAGFSWAVAVPTLLLVFVVISIAYHFLLRPTGPRDMLDEAFDRYEKQDYGRIPDAKRAELVAKLPAGTLHFEAKNVLDGVTLRLTDGRMLRLAYVDVAPGKDAAARRHLKKLAIDTNAILVADAGKVQESEGKIVAEPGVLMGPYGLSQIGLAHSMLTAGYAVLRRDAIRDVPYHYRTAAEIGAIGTTRDSMQLPFTPCAEGGSAWEFTGDPEFKVTSLGVMELTFHPKDCPESSPPYWLDRLTLEISRDGRVVDRYMLEDLQSHGGQCTWYIPHGAGTLHSLNTAIGYKGHVFTLKTCDDKGDTRVWSATYTGTGWQSP